MTKPHRIWLSCLGVLGIAVGTLSAQETVPASPPVEQEAAPSDGGEQLIDYTGVSRIFNVDRLTVVYPAKRSREGELAARRIAKRLRLQFGVDTVWSSDSEISAEQRSGHLLLLGWENSLLKGTKRTLPFSRAEDVTTFVGVESREDDDLVFIHLSPFNPEKYLVFWSRLDLERLRFSPFPMIGADWAYYNDFHPHMRGLLELNSTWPPLPLEGTLFEDALPAFAVRDQSPHFNLRYDGSTIPERVAQQILEAREQAWNQAVELVGAPDETFKIDIYLYPDEESKRRMTGVPDAVHSVDVPPQLHMLARYALNPNPHEEIQALVRKRWGATAYTALGEGIAVAYGAQTGQGKQENGVLAAVLLQSDQVPAIDQLLDEEQLREMITTGQGFAVSGLFVDWLRSRLGADAFAGLYGRFPLDAKIIAKTLGVEDPNAAFATWLAGLSKDAAKEVEFRKALAEAHSAGETGRAADRVTALERALTYRPQDLATRFRLAAAKRGIGDAEGAIREFRTIAETAGPSDNPYFAVHAQIQLGEISYERGDAVEAVQRFKRALELPDKQGAHELAEEWIADIEAESP